MSKSLVPERGARKAPATPQPKLARGTRDISPATLKIARGTRDLTSLIPLEPDEDTVVVDTDPTLADDLALDTEPGYAAEADAGEVSEVTDTHAAEIAAATDARMLELG
ncbi:MAG: hypothetical protein E6J91_50245 [Deltaproteobacteria bacterium]|nr:MAG: hypothetical protein E6J91_50245 [Deltaproteobacteria bacterium]